MLKRICIFFIVLPFLHLSAIWSPYVDVSPPGDSTSLGGPVLDVNILNNAVSVWANIAPASEQLIKASSYTFGLGWGPAVTISDTSLNIFNDPNYIGQGDPSVALNSLNYTVTAWEGAVFNPGPDDYIEGIFAVFRTPDGVWSSVQAVSTLDPDDDMLNPENPFVDVSDSGLAVAVWTELRDTGRFIMANFLPYAGTWGTPIELDHPTGGLREDTPMVQINSNNNAVAVWEVNGPTGGSQIGAATFNSSTGLWTTVVLDSTAPFDTGLPRVGIDEAGNAVAVWVRQIGFFPDISYEFVSSSFNYATQTWGPTTIIATGTIPTNPIGLESGNVVVDPFGNATAVWEQLNDTTWEVLAVRLPLGASSWSAQEVISDPSKSTFVGADGLAQIPISVDRQGNVIVFMIDENNVLQSITRFFVLGWQPIEIIATVDGTLEREIRLGSCGFAIAQWQNGLEDTVQAAENFGIFPPPTNLVISNCCQKFATQKRCLNILSWDPSPSCILYYQIYRDGVLVGVVPGNINTFTDPLCRSRSTSFQYTVIAVSIYGVSSLPLTTVIRA